MAVGGRLWLSGRDGSTTLAEIVSAGEGVLVAAPFGSTLGFGAGSDVTAATLPGLGLQQAALGPSGSCSAGSSTRWASRWTAWA